MAGPREGEAQGLGHRAVAPGPGSPVAQPPWAERSGTRPRRPSQKPPRGSRRRVLALRPRSCRALASCGRRAGTGGRAERGVRAGWGVPRGPASITASRPCRPCQVAVERGPGANALGNSIAIGKMGVMSRRSNPRIHIGSPDAGGGGRWNGRGRFQRGLSPTSAGRGAGGGREVASQDRSHGRAWPSPAGDRRPGAEGQPGSCCARGERARVTGGRR